MRKRIKKALNNYFTVDSEGRRVARKAPVGVSVRDAATRFCLTVTFTYRAGVRYCCPSPACAFAPVWSELKNRIQEQGIEVNSALRIYLHCVYERGARFDSHSSEPGRTEEVEANWESHHVVDEIEGWDPPELEPGL